MNISNTKQNLFGCYKSFDDPFFHVSFLRIAAFTILTIYLDWPFLPTEPNQREMFPYMPHITGKRKFHTFQHWTRRTNKALEHFNVLATNYLFLFSLFTFTFMFVFMPYNIDSGCKPVPWCFLFPFLFLSGFTYPPPLAWVSSLFFVPYRNRFSNSRTKKWMHKN